MGKTETLVQGRLPVEQIELLSDEQIVEEIVTEYTIHPHAYIRAFDLLPSINFNIALNSVTRIDPSEFSPAEFKYLAATTSRRLSGHCVSLDLADGSYVYFDGRIYETFIKKKGSEICVKNVILQV
jgi:hypothetical protein